MQMHSCRDRCFDSLDHFIQSDTRSSVNRVDFLPRRSIEIFGNRQINFSVVVNWMAANQGCISLSHGPSLELHRNFSMSLCVARHHHQTTRVSIKSMHDARASEFSGDTHCDAIRFFWADAGNRQDAARLIDHDQLRIEMYDLIPAS